MSANFKRLQNYEYFIVMFDDVQEVKYCTVFLIYIRHNESCTTTVVLQGTWNKLLFLWTWPTPKLSSNMHVF